MRQKHTFRQWIFSWVLPVTESERVIIIHYVTDSGGNNKQIINQSIIVLVGIQSQFVGQTCFVMVTKVSSTHFT